MSKRSACHTKSPCSISNNRAGAFCVFYRNAGRYSRQPWNSAGRDIPAHLVTAERLEARWRRHADIAPSGLVDVVEQVRHDGEAVASQILAVCDEGAEPQLRRRAGGGQQGQEEEERKEAAHG